MWNCSEGQGMDIQVQLEETNGDRIVSVEGELSLATAGQLRTVLLDRLQPGTKTILEASRITAVDLCGLQLICSAHRGAVLNGAGFELRGMPEQLRETARVAGYDACTSICPYRRDGNCMWKA